MSIISNPFKRSEQLGAPSLRPKSPPSSERGRPMRLQRLTREEAQQALEDPYAVSLTRWQRRRTVGATDGGKLVLVVQAWDEANQSAKRIISVRNASIKERRAYEIGEF